MEAVYIIEENGGDWDDSYSSIKFASADFNATLDNWLLLIQTFQQYKRAFYELYPVTTEAEQTEYNEELEDLRDSVREGELGYKHPLFNTTHYTFNSWKGDRAENIAYYSPSRGEIDSEIPGIPINKNEHDS